MYCWTANRVAPCHLLIREGNEKVYIGHKQGTREEAQEFKTKHPNWKVEVWNKECHDDFWPFDVLHPEELSTLVEELEPKIPIQECEMGLEGETILLGPRKENWKQKYGVL